LKPATYQADASSILMAPPAPPTPEQIAKNPALGRINTNNSYLRFGNLSIIVSLLSQTLTTQGEQQALVNQGADPRYTVALSDLYSTGAPIVQITATGDSAYSAIRTAQLVSRALNQTLYTLQHAQGTNPAYMITTLEISTPAHAQLMVSSKLRSVIAVLGLGALMLFVVISTMSARAQRRVSPRRAATDPVVAEPLATFAPPQHPLHSQSPAPDRHSARTFAWRTR
jgi:hypothetical protein